MRLRLLALLVAAAALLGLPAAASAKVTVGISENNTAMFADPLFTSLGAKHVRIVMAYDVMTSKDRDLQNRVRPYLDAARAAKIEPLVSFEHHAGDANICNRKKNLKKAVCALPSAKKYERNVKAFLKAFPWVKVISPWNEINHYTQPTSRNPKAAARFTDIVAKDCRKCTIVAADVLDQANDVSAKRPNYSRTLAYIRSFKAALRTKRSVCGIHNYSDVNRFRTTGTQALVGALGCKQVWLTETGGLYKFTSFWTASTKKGCSSNASCQLKATKYLFRKTVKVSRTIKRVYVYTWFGGGVRRFDSGLVADNQPRPAYREVKKHI
jgi:Glycosyl hydrolase catalytic core